MGEIQVRPVRWWAESAPPGWYRVKVSENLGATAVAPVAPADTSLPYELLRLCYKCEKTGSLYIAMLFLK